MQSASSNPTAGFTLIELSIVLVIIGLIVGGVLVGRDLIRAAEVRATITQIERYNTAVNTFYGKYRALPGDMNYSTAVTYGFALLGRTSPPTAGQGDGNGIIDGGGIPSTWQGTGETGVFWADLSSATAGGLIDGGYSQATETTTPNTALTTLPEYFPAAKLGRGNYIYVYEWEGVNYFGLSNVSLIYNGIMGFTSSGVLSPAQAYNIDKKVDDGFPNSGNVVAYYLTSNDLTPSTNASPGVAGNCWDSTGATSGPTGSPPVVAINVNDHGISGAPGFYLTTINNGEGTGCGLSFKFQ